MGTYKWETPFSGLNDYTIAIRIFRGDREEIIPGTPQEYVDIYKNCWSPEPEKRPKLNDILSNLDRLSAETSFLYQMNKCQML
ncbi:hypothetical protein C2G38_2086241 [Gigaspora rosea]|uniref:Serine-threonine/tyrosine-protein kinase catalytic domain-containing protein n=1 Tax=Gigaspora rosea TaxID=44941 RepID=A0A397VE73_9GLOM|nr:hypothetical protein C2G38_2086241 [Gigaspora rosea]